MNQISWLVVKTNQSLKAPVGFVNQLTYNPLPPFFSFAGT